jgi:hypothetical protein
MVIFITIFIRGETLNKKLENQSRLWNVNQLEGPKERQQSLL